MLVIAPMWGREAGSSVCRRAGPLVMISFAAVSFCAGCRIRCVCVCVLCSGVGCAVGDSDNRGVESEGGECVVALRLRHGARAREGSTDDDVIVASLGARALGTLWHEAYVADAAFSVFSKLSCCRIPYCVYVRGDSARSRGRRDVDGSFVGICCEYHVLADAAQDRCWCYYSVIGAGHFDRAARVIMSRRFREVSSGS